MNFAVGTKIRCIDHTSWKRGTVDFFMLVGEIVERLPAPSSSFRARSSAANWSRSSGSSTRRRFESCPSPRSSRSLLMEIGDWVEVINPISCTNGLRGRVVEIDSYGARIRAVNRATEDYENPAGQHFTFIQLKPIDPVTALATSVTPRRPSITEGSHCVGASDEGEAA
jgi:hypothetical protein